MTPNAIVSGLKYEEKCECADELSSHEALVERVGMKGISSIVERIAH